VAERDVAEGGGERRRAAAFRTARRDAGAADADPNRSDMGNSFTLSVRRTSGRRLRRDLARPRWATAAW
jgi:hypothetical protein